MFSGLHPLLLIVPTVTFQTHHTHTQFFARSSNYLLCLISIMNVQHVLYGSSGFAEICLHCCFSVAFLKQFVGDGDKEQPVRGPLCLYNMGTHVLRGPVRMTEEITHTHRLKCFVCVVGACACMSIHTRVSEQRRKSALLISLLNAAHYPLKHSHAGLLSPHLSD